MAQWKKICSVKNFILFLAGLAVSLFCSGILLCHTVAFRQIFPQGEVFDYDKENLTGSSSAFLYQEEKGCFLIASDSARKRFRKLASKQDLHYIRFSISHLRQEPLDCVLEYRDEEGNYRGCQNVSFTNGEQWVAVTAPEFRYFSVLAENRKGSEISFDAVQVRQKAPVSKKKLLASMGVFFLLYAGILYLCRNLRFRAHLDLWEVLTCFYDGFLKFFWKRAPRELSETVKSRTRTALFLLMFLGMWVSDILRLYAKTEYYKYHMLLETVLLTLVFAVSADKRGQTAQKRGPWRLKKLWLFYCVQICVSDFLVSKFHKFAGYAMLLSFGFAYYVWEKMERPQAVLEDLARALRILFWPGMLFCLFCREKKGAILYNGFCRNSSAFAVYALLFLIVFLAGLSGSLSQNKGLGKKRHYAAGVFLCLYCLAAAGSAVCLLTGGVFIVCFIIRNKKAFASVPRLAAGICLGILLVCGFHAGVKTIPQNTGLSVNFKREEFESWKGEEELRELSKLDPATYKNVERKQDTEYLKIWSVYLRRTGFFGNKQKMLKFGGKKAASQNSVIQILFRYGMIAVIPYLVLMCAMAKRMVFSLRKTRGAISEAGWIEIGAVAAFLAAGLFIGLEEPFRQPIWVVFYLISGKND